MKIRYQAGILAAALSLAMATAAFAASSSTTGMSGGNSKRPSKTENPELRSRRNKWKRYKIQWNNVR